MKIFQKIISGVLVTSLLTYYSAPVLAYMNEETIYLNLDSAGSAYKSSVTTIVEDKNGTNINQNEIEKALPIETKITYYLDDREVETNKIAGKKGRVTIKLEFENKDKHDDVYTPFVVVCGLMIDNSKNSNIEISNGKLLTNGNTTIAVGLAFPGMQESLELDESKIKIPSSVEISMDTDKFESSNIMVYASPKLLGELNISMSDFDEIFEKVNALETASKALENGAGALADGMKSLDEGAVKLDNGIVSLDQGIDTLKSGANDLNNGAIQLKNGTAEFAKNSESFNSGMAKVSDGVSALNTQYSELDNGINTLNSKSSELKEGASQLKDGAGAIDAGVTSLKNGAGDLSSGADAVLNGINSAVEGLAPNMTEEAKNTKKNALNEIISLNESALGDDVNSTIEDLEGKVSNYTVSLNQIPSSDELKAGVAAGVLTEEQAKSYEQTRSLLNGLIASLNTNIKLLKLTSGNYAALTQTKASISKTIDDTENLYNGLVQIQAGMKGVAAGANSLSGGLKDLSAGTSSLVKGAGSLSDGTVALSAGTASLADGSSKVVSGLESLNSGTTTLAESSEKLAGASLIISTGASKLQDGTNSLQNGVNTLSDGSKQLKNGSLSLTEGTLALVSGSQTLADGIKQFNQEGICKITDFVNNNGKKLIGKVEKLEKLSNEYTSFASEEKRDDLKFIAITDSVKVADSKSKKENEP